MPLLTTRSQPKCKRRLRTSRRWWRLDFRTEDQQRNDPTITELRWVGVGFLEGFVFSEFSGRHSWRQDRSSAAGMGSEIVTLDQKSWVLSSFDPPGFLTISDQKIWSSKVAALEWRYFATKPPKNPDLIDMASARIFSKSESTVHDAFKNSWNPRTPLESRVASCFGAFWFQRGAGIWTRLRAKIFFEPKSEIFDIVWPCTSWCVKNSGRGQMR